MEAQAQDSLDQECILSLGNAKTIARVGTLCGAFASRIGFEHFLYGFRLPWPVSQPQQFILNGYPKAWRLRYDEAGFMLYDPVVRQAVNTVTPYFWDELECATEAERTVMREAAAHGLVHGISAPVHGPKGEGALLSLARLQPLPESPLDRAVLKRRVLWFSTQLHENLKRIIFTIAATEETVDAGAAKNLSAREKDCLRLIAGGAIDSDVAKALRITERTVRFHLEQAFEKLGARKRSHAIARAVALGVVSTVLYSPQLEKSQTFVDVDSGQRV